MFISCSSMSSLMLRIVTTYSRSATLALMMLVCAVVLSRSSLCSCWGKERGGEVRGLSRMLCSSATILARPSDSAAYVWGEKMVWGCGRLITYRIYLW